MTLEHRFAAILARQARYTAVFLFGRGIVAFSKRQCEWWGPADFSPEASIACLRG